jgi:hypothetical protein
MKVVAFLTEYAVVDRIIRHLELTFIPEKPPPAQAFEQVALMAALMEAMRTARLPLRPSGPIICPTKLLPTGFRAIDTCLGPGYLYFMRGRVDSEPEAGDSMPREKRKFLSFKEALCTE